jgi:hypothetical protein
MKALIKIMVLVFSCQMGLAQVSGRIALHGQVKNDIVNIDGGYVINVTAATRSLIDTKGFFDIMAQPNDVLIVSSMSFQPKKVALTNANLQERLFEIKLEVFNNELSEVVISNGMKVQSIKSNTQGYVDKKYFDDAQSAPKNQVMTRDGRITDGFDFVRVFKEVKKILKKQSNVDDKVMNDVAFSAYVKANFDPIFFERDLDLKEDEIDLFLLFVSNDTTSREYLKPDDKFLLLDFLVSKNAEFKRITTFGK